MIGPWRKRDNLSTDRHQELVDAANTGARLFSASQGSSVINGPNGQGVITPRPEVIGRSVPVQITSAASDFGKYYGVVLDADSNAVGNAGSALNEPEGMNQPTGENALILNLSENAGTGHDLAVDGSYYSVGVIVGISTDGGKYIIKLPVGAAAAKPALFAVNITQIGGADSVGGGLPTWTYNVFDINDGTQLNTPGTPLAPETALRIAGFSGSPGDKGTCRHKPDGTLVLFWANEVPNWLQCGG